MQAYAFAGTTMTVLIPGSETKGAFAVLHVIKPSGSSTPRHSHDRELELSYVLSGTLSAETEGRVETRIDGEVLVLPPGRPHRLFNESGNTVREFLLCAPAVFDQFVAAVGSPVEPYAEPRPMTGNDRKRLVENAPNFGVTLLRSSEPEEASPQPFRGEQETRTIPGTRVEVLARLGPGDDDLLLMREVVEADRVVSLHSHPEPECVFVIKGALHVFLDGSGWRTLGADEALHVEPGRRHALRNVGGRPVHLLTVSTMRMTRFLAELASAEPDAVPELVTRYGHWQASPVEDAIAQLHRV